MKTKSGIILQDNTKNQFGTIGQDKPNFCIILDVGEGYYDPKTKKYDRSVMEVEVGDIVLIPKLSINYFSYFADFSDYIPDSIGITTEDSVQMSFYGMKGYESYFKGLNNEVD
jgi:co-chaperonin GroES (HSP10)